MRWFTYVLRFMTASTHQLASLDVGVYFDLSLSAYYHQSDFDCGVPWHSKVSHYSACHHNEPRSIP